MNGALLGFVTPWIVPGGVRTTSPARKLSVWPSFIRSRAHPCSMSHICSLTGCKCLAEVAPGSTETRVIVTRASGALLGHTICKDRTPEFCKVVKSAAVRR